MKIPIINIIVKGGAVVEVLGSEHADVRIIDWDVKPKGIVGEELEFKMLLNETPYQLLEN